MPNVPQFHPQIVHFAVAGLLLGVAFRIASLIPGLKFADYAATILLLIGTGAAYLAVTTGLQAHGPVERIPGARTAVQEHEEHGEQTKNIFLGVAAIELIAFGLARRPQTLRYVRFAHIASAAVGVFGSFALYEAAEGRIGASAQPEGSG